MEKVLKEKGYKITPARVAVLDVFYRMKIPLTAEDVCVKLKKNKRQKEINEATVYRTLNSFTANHILKRIDLRKDSVYFEIDLGHHHHHITCAKCEFVEDFKSNEIEKILVKIIRNSSRFINVKDHSLELFGLCKKCS